MPRKIITPASVMIEKVASEMACVFYEAARSQGATSKYKNARQYAKKYLEYFIPKAIDHLISMLDRKDLPDDQKALIYDCIMERHNDPDLVEARPNFDVKAIIAQIDAIEKRKQIVINIEPKTILHKDQ